MWVGWQIVVSNTPCRRAPEARPASKPNCLEQRRINCGGAQSVGCNASRALVILTMSESRPSAYLTRHIGQRPSSSMPIGRFRLSVTSGAEEAAGWPDVGGRADGFGEWTPTAERGVARVSVTFAHGLRARVRCAAFLQRALQNRAVTRRATKARWQIVQLVVIIVGTSKNSCFSRPVRI